jgi:hypothetical protein
VLISGGAARGVAGSGARRWGRHGGEGGRGVMLGSARSGSVGLGCAGSKVTGSIGQCEVGRVAQGQTGGVGECAGSVGWARGVRLIGWTVESR